ncbi:MAG: hypothetical protein JHC19_07830 [Desulfurococcaceae archaeon]|nr:hypothetical protein [Desulfurococcaceae archaeon]
MRILIYLYGELVSELGWSLKEYEIDEKISLKEFFKKYLPEIYEKTIDSDVIIMTKGLVIPLRDIDKILVEKDMEIIILPIVSGG